MNEITGVIKSTILGAVGAASGVVYTRGHWQAVLSCVADIEDQTQKALTEIALNDTQHWRRDSVFLAQCVQAIGLTQSEATDLFISASQIEV